ncbi:hypothetical protein [Niabella soli]|uniref:Uncharacterized protein n=1 Tax=Niabella soli DSM 19437 TaxID=929713 RepID=W0F7S6_9BACT|nr:hypothetical protein [Niabella soli]AHF17514.1 hypothetical protein NIASO_09105 [Niabella soli DSM 19437]
MDWSTQTHAYGVAQDVPILLDEIKISQTTASENAARELFEKISHQDKIEPISIYLIDPLLNILIQRKDDKSKWVIVNGLINLIRLTSSFKLNTLGFSPTRKPAKDIFNLKESSLIDAYARDLSELQSGIIQKSKKWGKQLLQQLECTKDLKYQAQLTQFLCIIGADIELTFPSLISAPNLDTEWSIANKMVSCLFFNSNKVVPKPIDSNSSLLNILMLLTENNAIIPEQIELLFSSATIRRFEFGVFPWCDGSLAQLVAQAISYKYQNRSLPLLKGMLSKSLEKFPPNSNLFLTEYEKYESDNDEYMDWGWLAPMLIANEIIKLISSNIRAQIHQQHQNIEGVLTTDERQALDYIKENKIETPNAIYYGLGSFFSN